jgi:hypothetical protein
MAFGRHECGVGGNRSLRTAPQSPTGVARRVVRGLVPRLDIMDLFVVDGRHRSRFSSPRLGLDAREAWEFIAEGAYDT